MRRFAIAALTMLLGACFGQGSALAPGPTATRSVLAMPSPSREPSELARLPEESAVLMVFAASGIDVDLIGGSKFEDLLGLRQQARVFIGMVDGSRVGADILFLDAPPGAVRVCSGPGSAPGFTAVTVFVNGAKTSGGEGSQQVFYLLSDRFFVQAFDARVRDALATGLSLKVPRC